MQRGILLQWSYGSCCRTRHGTNLCCAYCLRWSPEYLIRIINDRAVFKTTDLTGPPTTISLHTHRFMSKPSVCLARKPFASHTWIAITVAFAH